MIQATLAPKRRSVFRFLGTLLLAVMVLVINPGPAAALIAQNTTADSPAINPALEKVQLAYDKTLAKTQQAIADLSQQLEQLNTTADPAVRKQLRQILEDKQDDLENVADKFDDLAEKLQNWNEKVGLPSGESVSVALDQLSESLNTLADSTEKAKKNTTAELQAQIDQQRQNVQQAIDTVNQAFQSLI